MDLLEAVLLGIIQGLTEFLPISSSAHLVLVPWWLGLESPPLVYTVVVHLGTIVAVLAFFWQDWYVLLQAGWKAVLARKFDLANDPNLRLLVLLMLATLPAALAGVLLADLFEEAFSEPGLVSIILMITAVVLTYGEWAARQKSAPTSSPETAQELDTTHLEAIRYSDALIIGLAQAVAIMPGLSRSGTTIATGLLRGLSHHNAMRFSFLMSVPIILGAGAKQSLDVVTGSTQIDDGLGLALLVSFLTSAIIGYASIAMMLKVVRRQGLYGFAIYCAVFGLLSLGAVMMRG